MTTTELQKTAPAVTPAQVQRGFQSLLDRIPDAPDESGPIFAETGRINVIDTNETFERVGTLGQQLKAIAGDIEAHWGEYSKPSHALHKAILARFKAQSERVNCEIDRLKGLCSAYRLELRRKAEEEARKAEEEARRNQAEERRRIEEEAQREADRLAAEGKSREAEAVIEQAIMDAEDVKPTPIIVPPAQEPPKVAGNSATTRWSYEVADKIAFLRWVFADLESRAHFVMEDDNVLGPMVRKQKGEFCVPGVKTYEVMGENWAKARRR